MLQHVLQRLHKQSTIIKRGNCLQYAVTRRVKNSSQETCIMNCTEKFIKHSERVGARFAEQNAGSFLSFSHPDAIHDYTILPEAMSAMNQ